METKEKRTRIRSVHYHYVGTDEQFESFVKNVVRDYLTCNSLLPDTDEPSKAAKKSA